MPADEIKSGSPKARVAVITGGSSGFGAATARRLAARGFAVVTGARRLDRVRQLAGEIGGAGLELDVTDAASIQAFAAEVESRFERIDVLVNNAGLALGLSTVADTPDEDWIGMLDTNVLGLLRVTRACLPLLRRAPHAHIVNLGSIASFEVYRGGAGYTATKHAVRAITRTLRIELNGEPIRVSEVSPGMAETEFSLVRFKGDAAAAEGVYRGVDPLTADDVAEIIEFVVTRPPHVDIDEVVIRPVAQANTFTVARRSE